MTRNACALGVGIAVTVMFGHVETLAERVGHMPCIREVQDETGGFTAFNPPGRISRAVRRRGAPRPRRTRPRTDGACYPVCPEQEIHRIIRAAGFARAKRDTYYRILEREEGECADG